MCAFLSSNHDKHTWLSVFDVIVSELPLFLSPQMTEGRLCQVQLLDDRKLELLVQVRRPLHDGRQRRCDLCGPNTFTSSQFDAKFQHLPAGDYLVNRDGNVTSEEATRTSVLNNVYLTHSKMIKTEREHWFVSKFYINLNLFVTAEAAVVRAPWPGVLPLQPQRERILRTCVFQWQVCQFQISFWIFYLFIFLQRFVCVCLEEAAFWWLSLFAFAVVSVSGCRWTAEFSNTTFQRRPGPFLSTSWSGIMTHPFMQTPESPTGCTASLTLNVAL